MDIQLAECMKAKKCMKLRLGLNLKVRSFIHAYEADTPRLFHHTNTKFFFLDSVDKYFVRLGRPNW